MKEVSEKEWQQLDATREHVRPYAVFLYTPLCGTCKLTERMLLIIEEMRPALDLFKVNVNVAPTLVLQWQITSVPCVVRIQEGQVVDKLYAIQSIDHLLRFVQPPD